MHSKLARIFSDGATQEMKSKPEAKFVQETRRVKERTSFQRTMHLHQSKPLQPTNSSQEAEPESDIELQFEEGHNQFPEWVRTHQTALRQYCRSLVGSSWEADDLAQETWLKVWRTSIDKGRHFGINKSYLFRVANHICIDRHRKKRVTTESYPLDHAVPSEEQTDTASLWMAMEIVVNRLPVNQRITLLLIDVFRYTAAETAELLHTTEGAVKALLHRARMKLRSERYGLDSRTKAESEDDPQNGSPINEQTVYAYLKAFREHDTGALLMLMNESSALDQTQPPVLQKRQPNIQSHHGSKAKNDIQSLAMAA